MRLPDLSGIEVARRLWEKRTGIGVVLVTCGDPDIHRDELEKFGVRRCVSKLFALRDLPVLVREASAEARAAAGVSRAVCRRRARRPIGSPTEGELAVLRLVAVGASNQEAAEKLCVTVRTVEWHLTALYKKTYTKRRQQLVNLAYVRGWVGWPGAEALEPTA